MEALVTLLKSNPYFSAGFGLVGVGAGLALLRRGSMAMMQYGKRQLYVSIELPSTDKSYWWLMRWMRDKAPRQQHLTIRTSQQRDRRGVMQTDYEFLPGTGNHLLRYVLSLHR
jgi:chaperone BCS1